jgi:phosphodiester glycosidase
MALNSLSVRRARSVDVLMGRRSRLIRTRVRLSDGARTTLHVASYDRRTVCPRVVALDAPAPLIRWCGENGVRDALVGGFFLRSAQVPLGDIWVDGAPRHSVAFASPWNDVRACLHVVEGAVRIAPRDRLGGDLTGDLLQAGPLLVADGRTAWVDGQDREGFSAGAHQFDSDITIGRYPRAALAIAGGRMLAAACDGRSPRDAGMTLGELASALVDLGATDALNLDGGGSASLVHGGRLRNRPREVHGADLLEGRPIMTAIAFDQR